MKTYAHGTRREDRERKRAQASGQARPSAWGQRQPARSAAAPSATGPVTHNHEASELARTLLGTLRDLYTFARQNGVDLQRQGVVPRADDFEAMRRDQAQGSEVESSAVAEAEPQALEPEEPAEFGVEGRATGDKEEAAHEAGKGQATPDEKAAQPALLTPRNSHGLTAGRANSGVVRSHGAIVFEFSPSMPRSKTQRPSDTDAEPNARPSSSKADDPAKVEAVVPIGPERVADGRQATEEANEKDEKTEREHAAQNKPEPHHSRAPDLDRKSMPEQREPPAAGAKSEQGEGDREAANEAVSGEERQREVAPEPITAEAHELVANPPDPPLATDAPSPPAGGAGSGAELAAWKAAAESATAALPTPNLGPPSARTGGMSGEADAVVAGGEERRKELPKQAEKMINATPRDLSQLGDMAEEVLKGDTGATVRKVRDTARRSGLPAQVLPNLKPTPKGNIPNLYGDPITPALLNQLRKEYKLPEGTHVPDATELQTLATLMAQDAELKADGRVAGFAGQVVSGAELPPKIEVSPLHQDDFAAVLARIITGSEEAAKSTIDSARDLAYKSKALTKAFPELGNEWVGEERTFLLGEMQRVADAAGIASSKLEEAVAARHRELADKTGATQAAGAQVYTDAREKITADFQKTHGQIEGLRQEWEDFADRRASAMKGNAVDPKAVRAKQRELQGTVSTFAAEWIVAYDDMGKERAKKLAEAAQKQAEAYGKAIALDKEEDATTAEDAGDTEKAEAIRADKDGVYKKWVAAAMKGVHEAVGKHVEANGTTITSWQTEMRNTRKTALEELREWADHQIGRERGFFDMILDWIFGWEEAEKEEAKAFAKQRAGETTAATAASFERLDQARAAFGETLEEEERAQLKTLSEEQRAVVEAYYAKDGGDAIGAVAAGLKLRLKKQRAGEIAKAMQSAVLAKPTNTEDSARGLPIIAHLGFDVSVRDIVTACRAGFNHQWGTDESKIFGALGQVTSVEVGRAVRALYWGSYREDFETRLKSELAGGMFDDEEDYDRAKAQLEANKVDASAAELRIAVEGCGTDEEAIKGVLRRFQKPGKDAPTLEQVIAAYKRMYGEDLHARLNSEMSGVDLDVNLALYEKKEEKADAIELRDAQAPGLFGHSKDGIEKVYDRISKEEWERGKAEGKSVGEIEASITARLNKTSKEYTEYTQGRDLEQDYETLPANLKNLALGLQHQRWDEVDAARLQIERYGLGVGKDRFGLPYAARPSLYADDKVINSKVLGAQFDRAYQKKEWEAELRIREEEKKWNETHDTPWSADERRRRLDAAKAEATTLAQQEAAVSMAQFKATYMGTYEPGKNVSEFDDIIYSLTQGVGEEEARARLAGNGFLTPDQHVEFALKNDEPDDVKAQLKGKTAEQIAVIRAAWERKNPGKTFDTRVLGALSGREREDVRQMLVHGEPTNPTDALKVAEEKLAYEARTGGVSTYRDIHGNLVTHTRSEYLQLQAEVEQLRRDEAEWRSAQDRFPKQVVDDPEFGKVETQSAEAAQYDAAWQTTFSGVRSLVDTHRAVVDAEADFVSNLVAMVVAVTLAAVLAPFTAGASLAVLALVAAGIAAASTAALMLTKYAIKGDAYSHDEFMMDLAFGVVDVAVSAVTAGVGGKILKAAMAAKLAAKSGGQAVSKQVLSQAMKEAGKKSLKQTAASVGHETVQGLFGTLVVPAVMDEYGRDLNPVLGTIVGLGLGMGGGIALSKGISVMGNAVPKRPGHMPNVPDVDLADVRFHPEKLAALEEAYRDANPGRNTDDFLRDYDDLLLKQLKDEKVRAKWEGQARGDMLQHVPDAQKAQFSQTPIEMLSDKEFRRRTGSRKKGEAFVEFKNGKPAIIVRQGASPTALRREAAHLLQAVDELGSKNPGRLDGTQLRSKLKAVSEEAAATWRSKDVRERFARYGDKLDLEVDAAHRDLDMLREASRKADASPSIRREIAEVEAVLDGLTRRRLEMANIGPLRRTLMAWGGTIFAPKYLADPPRLFHKKADKRQWPKKRRQEAFAKRDDETKQIVRNPEMPELEGNWTRNAGQYPLTDAELDLLKATQAELAHGGDGLKITTVGRADAGSKAAHAHVRIETVSNGDPPVHFVKQSDGTFRVMPNQNPKYPMPPDGWHYELDAKGVMSLSKHEGMPPGPRHTLEHDGSRYKVTSHPESDAKQIWDATPEQWQGSAGSVPEPGGKKTRKGNIVERGAEDGIPDNLGGSKDPLLKDLEDRLAALPLPSGDAKAPAFKDAPDFAKARGDQDRAVLRTVARQALVTDELRRVAAEIDVGGGKKLSDLLPDADKPLLTRLFDDLNERLKKADPTSPTLGEADWDAYRRAVRDEMAKLTAEIHKLNLGAEVDAKIAAAIKKRALDAGLPIAADPEDVLTAMLRSMGDQSAGKGNLFTAFRRKVFEGGAHGLSSAGTNDMGLTLKVEPVAVKGLDPSGGTMLVKPNKGERTVDGYLAVTKDLRDEGGPPLPRKKAPEADVATASQAKPAPDTQARKELYAVDDKAGTGALKTGQAHDYAIMVQRGDTAGLIYLSDSADVASHNYQKLLLLDDPLVRSMLTSDPPRFYFAYFKDGQMKWYPPPGAKTTTAAPKLGTPQAD